MRKSFSSLLALLLLPLLALAQAVSVPKNIYFADLHLRISDRAQEEIQKKVDALHRNQTYFKMKVDLADAYFPVIERVFKEEGVPDDYKYLALQESGLIGDAVSTSNAVGYWQFKREAASDFNLRMDNKVDERRHIIEASRGAAKYFLRSNNFYNNWLNSLLSYYLGYSGAKPYTSPSDNGASRMDITEKANPYVLTFLAHKIAYESFVGKSNPPALSLREMRGTPGNSLADIAMATQTDYAELEKYNKWLLGGSIPSDKDYYVMVPVRNGGSDAGLLASKDEATPVTRDRKLGTAILSKRNSLNTITARPGDTKDKLALKAGISTRRFLKYNDMRNFDQIEAGATYYTEPKKVTAEVEYHVVQPGETLQQISQHYGIKLNYLLFKNRMKRNEVPVPGRVLWLQKRRPAHTAVEVRNLNPKKEGSTSASVVASYNQPVATATQTDTAERTTAETAPEKPQKDNIFRRFIDSFKRFKKPEPVQPEIALEEEAILPETTTTAPAAVKTEPGEVEWKEAEKDELETIEEDTPSTQMPVTEPQQQKAVLYPGKTAATTAPAQPAQQPKPDTNTVFMNPAPQPDTTLAEEAVTEENWIIANPATEDEPLVVEKEIFTEPATTSAPTGKTNTEIPATKPKAAATVAAQPATAPKPMKHVVKQGETLYAISRMYAVTVNDLTAWNKLSDQPLKTGQELLIAEPLTQPAETAEETTATSLSTNSAYHTVTAGETLYMISKKYSVSLEDLRNWNGLTDNNIRLGQELRVQVPEGEAAPAKATGSTQEGGATAPGNGYHTVAAGESMYQISRIYGVTIKDIMEWNNKSDFAVSVGEKLRIKKK
jgi:membrane-bound lytic murein transglycosylase D